MDRRLFLRALLAGAAGSVLDPEKLLWIPGAKTIFIPPANTFLDLISTKMHEAYRKLANSLSEELFAPSPLLAYLRSRELGEYSGFNEILTPFDFKKYSVTITV